MATFKDFDVEIENKNDVRTEQQNGTVAIAGTPVTITASGGRKILQIIVINQNKGPNANSSADLLYVDVDGTANDTTVQRGAVLKVSCYLDSFDIDANNNGTNYEVIMITED